ncbi:hypothetical protein BV20DRAFT_1046655 [Pilatotrama ljubarskyi]|nr:hypothetical protein BV20DRAFT_1046655 [Pilatotrama ljubarskyi]
MAYSYYQSNLPGWGTSQFQFGPPPQPAFQPQPSWRGFDFYNAHAVNPDPSLYESIMMRLRDLLGMGIGHHEARHWHRRVYSGLVSLSQLLPADIGAAAAYEAYRTWKHNSFLYEPLSADRERQREGLIGMAIAETQRLWQYSGRPLDTYGLRAACEAAASAAHVLADRLFGWTSGGGIGGGYASSYGSNADAYGYGDGYRRGRSRHNSFTAPSVVRVGSSPYADPLASPYGVGGVPGAAPMPIPGTATSYNAGMPGPYGAAAGMSGSYGATPGMAGSYGATPGMAASYAYGGASPNPYAAAPYGAGAYQTAAPGYPAAGYGVGAYGAGTYGAGTYGAGYGTGGGVVLPNGQTVPPGSTVIVSHSGRSRRHSSSSSGHRHHHHRHRSSSRSRYDDYERDRYGYGGRY